LKKLKIYLDTSVINFLFADDAQELQKITKEFFDKFVNIGIYEFYISDIVINEINATKEINKRNLLLNILENNYIQKLIIPSHEQIMKLAKLYISNKVFSENSLDDALHVAACVLNDIDILLSWNFKHLANIERERKINEVNVINNYPENLRILTPMEVINYEDI